MNVNLTKATDGFTHTRGSNIIADYRRDGRMGRMSPETFSDVLDLQCNDVRALANILASAR